MRDVADLAGVAPTTVSRAYSDAAELSPATLRRIESAAADLGYTVNLNARSLRRKSSGQMLVLLPGIGNPFVSLVPKGLEEGAREGGRALLVGDTGADATLADRNAGQLAVGTVDGLVLLDGRVPFAPRSRERGASVALAGRGLERARRRGLRALRRHRQRPRDARRGPPPRGLGHLRVAEIAGPDGNSLTAERSRGFVAGAAERGLALVGRAMGDFSVGSGEQAAASLLARPDPPSAVFAAEDGMAVGAVRTAAAAGLSVPGDLSVVGFDDVDFAVLHAPALTTVRQPRHALGRAAVAALTARIDGHPGPASPVILGHAVVMRDSAGPPRRRPRLAAANRARRTTTEREDRLPETLKGPGLFLAQFAGDAAPSDTLDGILRRAAGLGYEGVQIPTRDARPIDLHAERIRASHVKDAEFNPTARQGFCSGFRPRVGRAARFRSLGDGQVDFGGIFSKLAGAGYGGWAVLEGDCCLERPEDGAREGAEFIARHIIRTTGKAFDDFAGSAPDEARDRRMPGIG